ncbi:MAG: thioredoxin [bacterium]|nr:thioredoxin [bacterium]
MIVRIVIGGVVGAVIGASIGYLGRCSTGTCPLTSSPWSGAVFGALLGIMIAHTFSAGEGAALSAGPPPANVYEPRSEDEFHRLVTDAQGPVLVDFFAPWCGPCRRMMPEVHQLAVQHRDRLTVVKVNVDKFPQLAQRYQVQGVPTLLVVDNGSVREKVVGFRTAAQLSALVAEQH